MINTPVHDLLCYQCQIGYNPTWQCLFRLITTPVGSDYYYDIVLQNLEMDKAFKIWGQLKAFI